MLTMSNTYLGIPARLYRSPCEILGEMTELKEKIREVNETLSVHHLLMEVMSEWSDKEPEKWIKELEETLDYAKEALSELRELNQSLDELREELEDVRWAEGV